MQSLSPDITLSIHRPFLSKRATIECNIRSRIEPSQLALLGYRCLRLSRSLIKKESVSQIKGRDEKGSLTIEGGDAPIGDELFYYSVAIPADEEELENNDTTHGYYTLITKFESFPSAGSITHSVHEYISHPELGSSIVWGAPLEPKHLRCGIEFFGASHSSSLLAALPKVQERILLEASPENLSMTISAEKLQNWKQLPVSNVEFYHRFAQAVKEVTGLDITELYLKEIASK